MDSWKYLKLTPIGLHVSWSDGYFSATAAYLGEAGFGKTLAEAINGAGEMVCRLFGAPVQIARELNLSAELDRSAIIRVQAG
ncbi:hypothetical protein ABZ916_23665 [Streptomyces sp. NPDC046853]|uniref:hypothetical protein n=1 Tax=Streptomyces sp. NPDC046853 TaxID=3154920 RepID=UPI0033F0CE7F